MSSAQTFSTRIDLPAPVREKMIALLNQQLADTFDLFSQIKQAHWNVKGPQFIALHELFDKLAEDVEESVDTIAERATALGGTALGTARMAAGASRLAGVPGRRLPWPEGDRRTGRAIRRPGQVHAGRDRPGRERRRCRHRGCVHGGLAQPRQEPLVPRSPPPGVTGTATFSQSSSSAGESPCTSRKRRTIEH